MKSGEFTPSVKPIEVARAVTMHEWLLGIPPVAHTKVVIRSFEERYFRVTRLIIAFNSWAMNQLKKADRKTGWYINCANWCTLLAGIGVSVSR